MKQHPRHRDCVLRWVGVFVFCALAGLGCRERDGASLPAAYAYLPPDTSVLLVANVAALADTPAFADIEREIMETEEVGDLLRASGISIRDAVKTLYVAVSGAADPLATHSGEGVCAVVETNLPDGFLDGVIEQSGRSFQQETTAGRPVWVLRDDVDEIAIAALPKGHVAFGSLSVVTAALERAANGAPGLSPDASVLSAVGPLDTTAAVWGIAKTDDRPSPNARRDPVSSALALVDYLTWTLTHDAATGMVVDVEAICASEDNAQRVRSYVETLIGFASFGGGNTSGLAGILSSATISSTGNRAKLSVNIPAEVLKKAIEDARTGRLH